MDDESNRNNLERFPRYDQLLPFEPDEFVTAFTWAMNAASGRAHIGDPTESGFRWVEGDGHIREFRVADTPIARLTMAIKERYAQLDTGKYYSAAIRILALLALLESPRLAPWIRRVPGEPEAEDIADSVVEAAAVVRLNKELRFPVREFVRKVREIDAAKET